MRNVKYLLLLLSLPVMLAAQYTGGIGRGDAMTTITASALPVELISFTASTEKKIVSLNWQTATESNNFGFDVERKTSGVWVKIGFVEGHGTTNAPQSYSFIDNSASGKVAYRLKQIDRDGKYEYSQTVDVKVSDAVTTFAIGQNYPNPFNPTTTISYSVPEAGRVVLIVSDALGREVASLVNEKKDAGRYSVQWDASARASGVYFYALQAGAFRETKRMMLIK